MYARVSYTALERFERCSEAHLLNVQKLRSPMLPEYVLVGNAMHYGMAVHVDSMGRVRAGQASLWEFERRLREEKPHWDRVKIEEMIERVRSGGRVLEEILDGVALEHVRSEVRLFKHYKGWSIDGYLDLMVGTGFEVWDLKTGRWHHDQLVFYDVLVTEVLGRVPDTLGVIAPFAPESRVVEPVADEERQDMRARILEFVRRVTADDWDFEGYSSECSRCRSKAFCPKWEQARSGKLGA